MTQPLDDRKNALEEEFFRKQNSEAVDRLRAIQARGDTRNAMAETTGITDDAVLDRLIDEGLNPASVAALSLVPLIAVAWADRRLDKGERDAILADAAKSGLSANSAGYELLESWLREAPPDSLFATWVNYAGALAPLMANADRGVFRDALMTRVDTIAEAAGGGFVGLGSKVSDSERRIMDAIQEAFADS